jgi:hypothetical protein
MCHKGMDSERIMQLQRRDIITEISSLKLNSVATLGHGLGQLATVICPPSIPKGQAENPVRFGDERPA